MSIEKDLKEHGFIEYKNNILAKDAKTSYQLRVRNNQGVTKYFINVDLYDFSYIVSAPESMKKTLQPQWNVRFQNSSGVFNVDYFGENIQEVLGFYEDMFQRMECTNYD